MKNKRLIVILTGAGISAESGLATFRGQEGLWEDHRIEDVATPQAFSRDPSLVYRFYNLRRRDLLDSQVKPNIAHEALVKLENEFEGEVVLITQNVDNLHEQAGSKLILHMHGELLKMRCLRSGKVFAIESDLTEENICDCCQSAGNLRPHIVWFGEMPLHMDRIEQLLINCDLFISIGTSGLVYPAAGFVEVAKSNGKAQAWEVNLDQTNISPAFDQHFIGKASEQVPLIVGKILNKT